MAPLPTFRLDEPATISEQFKLFDEQVIMKPEYRTRLQEEILDDLKPVLSKCLASFDINTFGSTKTGVALKSSDFDLNISTGGLAGSSSRNVISCSKELMADANFTVEEAVPHAKVPIIIARHTPTKTNLDLSFDNNLGNETASLLQYYFNGSHPRLEAMRIIKFWTKKQGITDGRKAISSYGWDLLFVAYLQTLKSPDGTSVVPAVYQMQPEACGIARIVQGCRVDFKPPLHPASLDLTSLKILNGFFHHYKDFNFRQDIVCPFLGTKVSRFSYGPTPTADYPLLTQYVRSLRSNLTKSGQYKYLRIIQDVFKHEDFVVCPLASLSTIQEKISRAAGVCDEAVKGHNADPNYSSRFLEKLFS